jgi:uracil-DNA glycosylase
MGKTCPLTNAEISYSYCYECEDKICEKIETISNLIPTQWKNLLSTEFSQEYFIKLCDFVNEEYNTHTIYPSKENIFNAIKKVPPKDVKVVILGQDPYHEPNQAQGLSFSVNEGVPLPKSLINIFKELETDLGYKPSPNGNLSKWAEQGVLLLNTVLTVREHNANSHKNKGWENFTKQILKIVLEQPQPKVFILWGKQAENTFFEVYKHQPNVMFIKSPHPSPLSAHRGFFGSKPFSKTNSYLRNRGQTGINWSLNN